jgi:hypothetical protein
MMRVGTLATLLGLAPAPDGMPDVVAANRTATAADVAIGGATVHVARGLRIQVGTGDGAQVAAPPPQ